MSSSSPADKLVYMANQIGNFFASQRSEDPKAGISNHIQKFWEPRMREQIFSYIDNGGQGLKDVVRDALIDLKSKQKG